MDETPAETPDDPDAVLVATAALAGACAVALPLWDALDRYALVRALAGISFASSGEATMPLGVIGYPLLGVALGWAVVRARRHSARRAGLVVGALLAWTVLYAGYTGAETARTRSHAVDGWNLCEDPAHTPAGYGAYVSPTPHPVTFDGPHLDNGDPCVRTSENRAAHARESPDGDVADGLAQIGARFPKDRGRTIFGSLFTVGGLVAAWLVVRRERDPTARAG